MPNLLLNPVWTVYRTVRQSTGKSYIGVHKTRDPNDRYLGSGTLLGRAIKAHGRESFEKEVLFIFDNPEAAYSKEAELVNGAFVERRDTYNLQKGGAIIKFGREGEANSQHGTAWVHRGDEVKKVKLEYLEEEEVKGWIPGRGEPFRNLMAQVAVSREPGSTNGPHHSRGWVWVHKGPDRRRVPPGDVSEMAAQGWQKGMCPPRQKSPKGPMGPRIPLRGERNAAAKLTWAQVREIRGLHGSGDLTHLPTLAERFGVSKMTISKIVRGILWIE